MKNIGFKGFMIIAVAAVLATMGIVYGAGQLNHAPAGYVFGGDAIQQFSPTATQYKSLGTGGKGVFKNFTTTTSTALAVQGYTGTTNAPTAVALKYRVGGCTTGRESDFLIMPSTGGTLWVGAGVNKICFQAISTATSAYVSAAVQ